MTNNAPARIPDGWVSQSFPDTFSAHAGPFYFRSFTEKEPGVGFFSQPHHANAGGVIHGGALMTLADMSLWDICRRVAGPFRALTVTMNAEFVGPGKIGEFIMATGEATKIGRSLMFARGKVTCADETLLVFSGSLKRIRPQQA
ncbi:MAG: PaaI family thioesterase [Parvularculaceae bacterium]|nr:PaaI family thioesterase [Parvularculaceae bacterium]